jgi:hypothetical protein
VFQFFGRYYLLIKMESTLQLNHRYHYHLGEFLSVVTLKREVSNDVHQLSSVCIALILLSSVCSARLSVLLVFCWPSSCLDWSIIFMITRSSDLFFLSVWFLGSSIQHPSVGVPQSSGFTITSLQPNFLDCPLMAMSSPLQQSHYLWLTWLVGSNKKGVQITGNLFYLIL